MGSDHGAITIMEVPVQLALSVGLRWHRREELRPDPCSPPTREAVRHDPPRTIALGEIPPGNPGAEHPQEAIDDRAMVMGGSPSLGFLGWEQGVEPVPLDVGQFASVHVASPPFQLERIARPDQSLQTRPSADANCSRLCAKSKHHTAIASEFDSRLSPPYACSRSARFKTVRIPSCMAITSLVRRDLIGHPAMIVGCLYTMNRGHIISDVRVCNLRNTVGSFGLW
jgi:hypothetical protein